MRLWGNNPRFARPPAGGDGDVDPAVVARFCHRQSAGTLAAPAGGHDDGVAPAVALYLARRQSVGALDAGYGQSTCHFRRRYGVVAAPRRRTRERTTPDGHTYADRGKNRMFRAATRGCGETTVRIATRVSPLRHRGPAERTRVSPIQPGPRPSTSPAPVYRQPVGGARRVGSALGWPGGGQCEIWVGFSKSQHGDHQLLRM